LVKNYRDVLFGEVEIGVGIGNTSGSANYKYKFQGQERQEELGLNWDSFKWRNYMPDIGRFFNVDPLAEGYRQSVFAFGSNQPVYAKELGMDNVPVQQVQMPYGNYKTIKDLIYSTF